MIVYVVTIQLEKTRKVEAVFDEHKQAAYYCAVKNHEGIRVEEWDTDAIKFSGNKELLCCWCAQFGTDDSLISLEETYTFEKEHSYAEDTDGCVYVSRTMAYGTPEETVKKMLFERLAEYRRKMRIESE